MQRIFSRPDHWPLHNTASSRLIEQQALAGVEAHTLMRRAGHAVAALARALRPHARSAWIACGPGNNGGDGLGAAIHLLAAGLQVEVTLAADVARLPGDAQDALKRAQAAGVSISSERLSNDAPDIAIDALLGIGGQREPAGELARWITELNQLACPVLAVDLPSGMNADTGQPHGSLCVVATHTLALLTLKPGLFTGSGRDFAGEVWFDTLDIEPPLLPPVAWLANTGAPAAPRQHAQHKGSFGDLAVVGGAPGMVGAALLAARAAHAAGAGRVYVSLLDPDASGLDPLRPELMFRPTWWEGPAEVLRQSTVVCGCGGGDAVRKVLPRLLSCAGRLVLDADALNAIASDSTLQLLLAARRSHDRETVLTPHPLEAARLLNMSTGALQADRLVATQQLAERFNCVVVLKGSGSVVTAAFGTPSINASGNAALASAGTGDVLAGWLSGCWSAASTSALQAARHATWLHGHAADRSRVSPLRASDLVEAMHVASPR
ncbi:MAG: NAD(P)H-hydrate dehydratase [Rhizobacter sp.]|nr:NAD(P)H-hydrate dehydratase [Rhizobacter sp.]